MPQNIFDGDAQVYSIVNYVGDGSVREFAVPFPYLYKDDIHIFVNKEEVSLYPTILSPSASPPVTFDAFWIADDRIKFVTAPANETKIIIKRQTNKVEPEVVFKNSSILHEEDLNTNTTQVLYITQEAYDALNATEVVEKIEEVTETLEEVQQDVTQKVAQFNVNAVQKTNAINQAGTTHLNNINTAGTTYLNNINTAGATQKAAVNTAGAAKIEAINATAADQMEDIIEECTLQYQRIHVAGELQTQRIEDYADRAIEAAEAQADRAEEEAQQAEAIVSDLHNLSITVESTTTSPGVALLDHEHNILRIQVPKGADGATPTFVQGTTTTTEAGTLATATLRTVSTDTYAIDFTIPRGATGAAGRDGERGPAGPSGDISTALDAQFLAFDIDATGNLVLKYTGTALEPTYNITPEGYLEVTL